MQDSDPHGGGLLLGVPADRSSTDRPAPAGVKANEHDRSLTPRDVLAVLADFDRFGGSSVALIAWELGAPEESVADLASQAAKEGLLRPSGVDPVSGEDMWRLTGLGRKAARMSLAEPAED